MRTEYSENRTLLLTSEVARLLRVTPETVRRWERTGSLSARKTATGVRLFDLGEVKRFTRRREGSIQADRGTRE